MVNFYSGNPGPILPSQVDEIAKYLNCESAALWAVIQVESGGRGFLSDDRPKILYEAHIFYNLTGGAYGVSNVSNPVWDRSLYGAAGAHQYDRLKQAMSLDEEAALKSASWGMFQIMGMNYKTCGCSSVHEFVEKNVESEKSQLDCLAKFLKNNKLVDELQDHRWADFARQYNGPGYASNAYDIKLATAYKTIVARDGTIVPNTVPPVSGATSTERDRIRKVQVLSNSLNLTNPPLIVDGWFGPKTEEGIRKIQAMFGIPVTGQINNQLLQLIE